MATILFLAGHGELDGGGFDSGATGFITKGEHKYFEEDFLPAVKKFLPKDADVVLFSDYNVYDHGNIVSLANQYGNDTIVVEMHYDAASASATGGHVIVHAKYAPDNIDLKIRDVIKKHIGVRYNHKGHQGISGRDNLANVNRSADGNINYRLVELGFGTNQKDSDIMVNQVDAIAKDFVEALVGQANDKPVEVKKETVQKAEPVNVADKSIDELAREVIQGTYGGGQDRKNALGSKYDAVQARVNEMLGGNKSVPAKSIDTLVKETLAGVHSNGEARKKSLGANYDAVMAVINGEATTKSTPKKSIDQLAQEVIDGKHKSGEARKKSLGNQYDVVQKRVNEILSGGKKSSGKSVDQLAREVIDGKWGNNPERNKKLKAAGHNAEAVQKRVNELL